jgi:hypothetical protein
LSGLRDADREAAFVGSVGHDPAFRIGEAARRGGRLGFWPSLLRVRDRGPASAHLLVRPLFLLAPFGQLGFRLDPLLLDLLTRILLQVRLGLRTTSRPGDGHFVVKWRHCGE